jgi:S1-C subfamily serine protease
MLLSTRGQSLGAASACDGKRQEMSDPGPAEENQELMPAAHQAEGPPDRGGRKVIAALVAALVLLGGGIGIGWELTGNGTTTFPPATRSPLVAASPAGPSRGHAEGGIDSEAVAAKVSSAVVDVNTVLANPLGEQGAGAGTGMVISSSGQVLTNNHVIEGASRITVTVNGRSRPYTARVVGADPSDDIALLQVEDAPGLHPVAIGDSSALRIGQEVVAIGNAFGRGGSPAVSEGTVSGLGRSVAVGDGRGGVERLAGLIQTNASIEPGESGGPLANSVGQVVGMITAGTRPGFGTRTSGAGFAIPSNTLLPIVNQIRAGRSSSSVIIGEAGFLGVVVRDLDRATAARLGLNVTSGVLVLAVNPGSPAEGVGISRDAVITAIDGHPVASVDALGAAIHRHKPGEEIRVTWVNRAGTHTATASLVSGPAV